METASARIMIAALHGRSGKTVITIGLLRALARRGIVVQPFKKGPDFVDAGWHSAACKRMSRNLDRFFMTPEQIGSVLSCSAEGSDLSIIEGAMGLFDGMDLQGTRSSAEIAKITQTPVILVVDTTRMTRTSAALVLGCQQFDPEVRIVGVILNRVRGRRHEQLTRESIESTCGIPVIGALKVNSALDIPDRHLGLISSEEFAAREETLDNIADIIEASVDLDRVVALAQDAGQKDKGCNKEDSMLVASPQSQCTGHHARKTAQQTYRPRCRIAIVRDTAFCFYYEENLQALQDHGAELVFVNSLKDASLPANIDALYIGGGYPEVFAAKLEANESFRSSVREQIEANLPVYAECGGLMFLGRSLICQGHSYEMVGALSLDTTMQKERQAHGYSVLEATNALPWFEPGSILTGHEFHHSKVIHLDSDTAFSFAQKRGQGIDGKHDGVCYKGVIALYTHVNALASPHWAEQMVKQAVTYQKSKQ